jgi:hypothetical protein
MVSGSVVVVHDIGHPHFPNSPSRCEETREIWRTSSLWKYVLAAVIPHIVVLHPVNNNPKE